MAGDTKGLKSAYELALERLESGGIARPDQSALSDETRAAMAESRQKAEAKLAELEILHTKEMDGLFDPAERARAEEEYSLGRRMIEERRDREIDRLREASATDSTDQS
jgi:hypothetical protein